MGKNGAGKGKGFGKDQKGGGGKGYGQDQKGKDGGQGVGKGERPVGACSHCWGFGHYYRACHIRLGPEAAAQAEKDYSIAVAKGDKGKGKGKKGKGKGHFAKRVYMASMATTALKKMEETHARADLASEEEFEEVVELREK